MRRKRIVQAGKCYHLVSRVAHKAFFFDDEEKDRFVDLLMRVEFFCCVKVLAYCCMSNHIHVFIFLEEGREMSEGEILARVNALYRGSEIVKLHKAAISARIGEIDEAAASGGIVEFCGDRILWGQTPKKPCKTAVKENHDVSRKEHRNRSRLCGDSRRLGSRRAA